MKLPPSDEYSELRGLVVEGYLESAAKRLRARRGRVSQKSERLEQRLLSARIVLKEGRAEEALVLLGEGEDEAGSLRPDVDFVRGLAHFSLGRFDEGIARFEAAAHGYAGQDPARELLCRYNVLAGRENRRLSPALDPERLLAWTAFLGLARERGSRTPLGLALRQRSAIYQEMGKTSAAAEDAEEAIVLLEGAGSHADWLLALAQAADVAIDQEQPEKARARLDRFHDPVEARVAFARAYVQARLDGELERFHPSEFEVQPPLWLDKWARRSRATHALPTAWQWAKNGAELTLANGERIAIRRGSLEGRLLDSLRQGPHSRARLCETLWPGLETESTLDERFHRLVSRTNKKHRLIEFDGDKYRLA